MSVSYRVLAINPGSTSTKVGLFEGTREIFVKNVSHDAQALAAYTTISEQLPLRRDSILTALRENNVEISDIDAFVGRGGGLVSVAGGVYEINEALLEDARCGANGVRHPAQLGSQLAAEFADLAGLAGKNARSFVVNPPDTDEFCDSARMTGIKGVYRTSHLHALNLKETAIRHAASMGKAYEDCNFIVCHIGGGISISAHRQGKMIDGNDIVGGEGPMAPTRAGSLPVAGLLSYLETHSVDEARRCCMKTGGFVDLLGTADAKRVSEAAQAGDSASARVWDAMIYQICKEIGQMACVLKGHVDGILLGGGMVFNKELVAEIIDACGWIAPVCAYPGEFELEAMAAGACRVLSGTEKALVYTGVPVFLGFAEFED